MFNVLSADNSIRSSFSFTAREELEAPLLPQDHNEQPHDAQGGFMPCITHLPVDNESVWFFL